MSQRATTCTPGDLWMALSTPEPRPPMPIIPQRISPLGVSCARDLLAAKSAADAAPVPMNVRRESLCDSVMRASIEKGATENRPAAGRAAGLYQMPSRPTGSGSDQNRRDNQRVDAPVWLDGRMGRK